MSNRAAAQALFLSEKTIEAHLASAYRKLGVSSRVQLPEALAATDPAPDQDPRRTSAHPQASPGQGESPCELPTHLQDSRGEWLARRRA
jgi:hypothetical protein